MSLREIATFMESPQKDKEATRVRYPDSRKKLLRALKANIAAFSAFEDATTADAKAHAAGFVRVGTAILGEVYRELAEKPAPAREKRSLSGMASLAKAVQEPHAGVRATPKRRK
jgi:hypothetical protein